MTDEDVRCPRAGNPARQLPGFVPATVAAGVAFATAAVYITVIVSQEENEIIGAIVIAAWIVGLGLAALVGASRARPDRVIPLGVATGGLWGAAIVSLFSIGILLLVAGVFALVAWMRTGVGASPRDLLLAGIGGVVRRRDVPAARDRVLTIGPSGDNPAASIARMLPRELVEEVLRAARRRGGSFSELFVEERTSTSIRLDDGKVEELTSGLDRGAGVRVALGTSYGYAYSNRLDRDSLLQAADAASAALREGEPGSVVDLTARVGPGVNRTDRPAGALPAADKVDWLRELDAAARGLSPEVVQVIGMYGDSLQRRLIATSDGRWVEEERPRIRLVTQVVAARDGTIQTGFFGPAACGGLELFGRYGAAEIGEKAAQRAVTMLDSIPAPAGEMAVVLAPGMGGVLFHEAVGHPLEADAVDKEASVYRGLVGTACASEVVNGIDDATLPNGWGSFDFDDEGEPSQRTVLFEGGVLQGYLYDRLRADKDGVPSTGNGRRESYASPPIPRMTNTNILDGPERPDAIIEDTDEGVFVTSLGGGQVNPASGDFVFGCSEAFLIEGGKISTPVRGANLIGRAIQVMSAVDAVAGDFDTWEGVCGKDGQQAPVGSGSPTLRISRITVGGTSA